MATENDDFEAAFAQFSSPDDKAKDDQSAAAASTDGEGEAAKGGEGDGAAAAAEGAGAAAAGDGAGASGDSDTGSGGGDEGSGKGAKSKPDAAAADAAKPGEGEGAAAPASKEGDDGAGAAPAGSEAAASGPSADDILAGLKKLVTEAPAPASTKDAPKAEEKPTYNDEETQFLTKYEEDWGDVSKVEALKRRAEYQQLLGYVFQQVADYLKPFKEMTEALAERTHYQDVTTAVPDYSDKLREDVTTWVKAQPGYLQDAYNQVITSGTVEEVKDLVDRYRAATGQAAPAATQKPASKDNELSDEAKKAAAALAPVESKRSGVQQPGDPSNFDDAWKQFATDSV